jgi:hypothetical protein
MLERGVPSREMLRAARKGADMGGRRGCKKRCKGGICAVVGPAPLLGRRTILTTYYQNGYTPPKSE